MIWKIPHFFQTVPPEVQIRIHARLTHKRSPPSRYKDRTSTKKGLQKISFQTLINWDKQHSPNPFLPSSAQINHIPKITTTTTLVDWNAKMTNTQPIQQPQSPIMFCDFQSTGYYPPSLVTNPRLRQDQTYRTPRKNAWKYLPTS